MAISSNEHCTKCQSAQHGSSHCMSGEDLIDFSDTFRNIKQQSNSLIDLEDVRYNLPALTPIQPSTASAASLNDLSVGNIHADDLTNDLADGTSRIEHPTKPPEVITLVPRSPDTPTNDPHFDREMAEAIHRSLLDQQTQIARYDGTASASIENIYSEDEDPESDQRVSVRKVLGWKSGVKKEKQVDKHVSNAKGLLDSEHEKAFVSELVINKDFRTFRRIRLPPKLDSVTLAPPKPDPLIGMVPLLRKKSDKAAHDSTMSMSDCLEQRGGGRDRKDMAAPVTRITNEEKQTVMVSAIHRKRRGKGNLHSYYDITPELQYGYRN